MGDVKVSTDAINQCSQDFGKIRTNDIDPATSDLGKINPNAGGFKEAFTLDTTITTRRDEFRTLLTNIGIGTDDIAVDLWKGAQDYDGTETGNQSLVDTIETDIGKQMPGLPNDPK